MRVQKKPKAFAYRVPIGDYNYLQCMLCTLSAIIAKKVEEGKRHALEFSHIPMLK